jgi:soluble P-type ATPase
VQKLGIKIQIPGFGTLDARAVCSDYTGTLSCGGTLIRGVKERLRRLAKVLDIHVVTSDTRKTASRELETLTRKGWLTLVDEIPGDVHHDVFKRQYIKKLGVELEHVVLFGNGRNDRMWLKAVKDGGGLAVAVDVGEGCAIEAMMNSHVFVNGITNALDLLLDPRGIIGTLRTEGDR